jgi:hypothetical protein
MVSFSNFFEVEVFAKKKESGQLARVLRFNFGIWI